MAITILVAAAVAVAALGVYSRQRAAEGRPPRIVLRRRGRPGADDGSGDEPPAEPGAAFAASLLGHLLGGGHAGPGPGHHHPGHPPATAAPDPAAYRARLTERRCRRARAASGRAPGRRD